MLQDSKLFAASFKRRNRLKKTFPMLLHSTYYLCVCMYGSVKKLNIFIHSDCHKNIVRFSIVYQNTYAVREK